MKLFSIICILRYAVCPLSIFISIYLPLENFPPKILIGPSEVNVTINTTATITVVAEDPNNDSLTFSVTGTLPTGYTKSSNDSAITISWTVTITKVIRPLESDDFVSRLSFVDWLRYPVVDSERLTVCARYKIGGRSVSEEN